MPKQIPHCDCDSRVCCKHSDIDSRVCCKPKPKCDLECKVQILHEKVKELEKPKPKRVLFSAHSGQYERVRMPADITQKPITGESLDNEITAVYQNRNGAAVLRTMSITDPGDRSLRRIVNWQLDQNRYDCGSAFDSTDSIYTIPRTGKYRIHATFDYESQTDLQEGFTVDYVPRYQLRVFPVGTSDAQTVPRPPLVPDRGVAGEILAFASVTAETTGSTLESYTWQDVGQAQIDVDLDLRAAQKLILEYLDSGTGSSVDDTNEYLLGTVATNWTVEQLER